VRLTCGGMKVLSAIMYTGLVAGEVRDNGVLCARGVADAGIEKDRDDENVADRGRAFQRESQKKHTESDVKVLQKRNQKHE